MPYRLDPQVAGELGAGTVLDSSTYPPRVSQVDYVLDRPDADEFIQSFPVFLVSMNLGVRLHDAGLTGFELSGATVRPSDNYTAIYGKVPPQRYQWLQVTGTAGEADCWLDESFQVCVSDRMMSIVEVVTLTDCVVEPVMA